jgi:hypothetical protein
MHTPIRHAVLIALAVGLSALAASPVAANPAESKTRGYVVADSGVARMAPAEEGADPASSAEQSEQSGTRLTIKSKSPRYAHGNEPIGVNEPGVNARGIEKKDIRRGMARSDDASTSGASEAPARDREGNASAPGAKRPSNHKDDR